MIEKIEDKDLRTQCVCMLVYLTQYVRDHGLLNKCHKSTTAALLHIMITIITKLSMQSLMYEHDTFVGGKDFFLLTVL